MHAPVMDRGALGGLERHHVGAEAERPEVRRQVCDSHRARLVPQVLEQPGPVRPFPHFLVLVGCGAGAEEVTGPGVFVDCRKRTVCGPRQFAGAVDDLAQDRVEIETAADPEDGPAEAG